MNAISISCDGDDASEREKEPHKVFAEDVVRLRDMSIYPKKYQNIMVHFLSLSLFPFHIFVWRLVYLSHIFSSLALLLLVSLNSCISDSFTFACFCFLFIYSIGRREQSV